MGYTHYWRSTAIKPTDEQIARAMQDLRIIVDTRIDLADYAGEPGSKPMIEPRHIAFNGIGPDSHETFAVSFGDDNALDEFTFCKTAQKPYDVVVVACLCALADRLGPAIEVTSDGEPADWVEGLVLARTLLGRASINLPANVGRS